MDRAQQNAFSYHVDLVFCIDSTGSMAHIISIVKQKALALYGDIYRRLFGVGKHIDQMRVRIISFRDYLADGNQAMLVSDFFVLPHQEAQLQECVNLIEAKGGGDLPEDGLEALAYAMKSSWASTGIKRRHVIVVWSDAATHSIGHGSTAASYPTGMPASFDELSRWWDGPQLGGVMDESARRLIIFAPDAPEWNRISANWEHVIHVRTVSEGLAEVDYQQVLDVIANSI